MDMLLWSTAKCNLFHPTFNCFHYFEFFPLTSPLLSSRYRSRFLDKDRAKGKRPLSTETPVLLYGGRPNHAVWRNQVRHNVFFLWQRHLNLQVDWQFTPNICSMSPVWLRRLTRAIMVIYRLTLAVFNVLSKIIYLHGSVHFKDIY